MWQNFELDNCVEKCSTISIFDNKNDHVYNRKLDRGNFHMM